MTITIGIVVNIAVDSDLVPQYPAPITNRIAMAIANAMAMGMAMATAIEMAIAMATAMEVEIAMEIATAMDV